jgi:hypothetical protein
MSSKLFPENSATLFLQSRCPSRRSGAPLVGASRSLLAVPSRRSGIQPLRALNKPAIATVSGAGNSIRGF